MKQYPYRDYSHYKESQISANKEKLDWIYVHRSTMKHISSKVENVENILCHGSRNGKELNYFQRYYPNAKSIIGTDISPTAKNFDGMVEWDFHNVNDEWTGKFDIVYSNSFDHSFDPIKALETWAGQLSPNGVLCVEIMVDYHNKSTEIDPLQLNLREYENMLNAIGFKIFDVTIAKSRMMDTVSRLTMSKRI